MKTYQVQINEGGRWRRPLRDAIFTDLGKAKKRVTMCDEDGLFSPSFRIIGDGFMYTYDDWKREQEAAKHPEKSATFNLHPVRNPLDERPTVEYPGDIAPFRDAIRLIAGMPTSTEKRAAYDDAMDMLVAHARIIYDREGF